MITASILLLTDGKLDSLIITLIVTLGSTVALLGTIIFQIVKWLLKKYVEAQLEKDGKIKANFAAISATVEKLSKSIDSGLKNIETEVKHEITEVTGEMKKQCATLNRCISDIGKIKTHLKIKDATKE